MQHPPITRFPLSLSYLNSISAPSLPAQLGPKPGIRTRPSPFLPALLYRSSISPLRPKSASYPPWVMKSPPNSTLKHLRRASSAVRGSPPASDPDISLPIPPAPGWILFFSPKKGGEEGKNPNPQRNPGSQTSPRCSFAPSRAAEPRSPHPCLKFVFSNASCSIILVYSPLQPYLSSSLLSSPSHSI